MTEQELIKWLDANLKIEITTKYTGRNEATIYIAIRATEKDILIASDQTTIEL